MDVTGTYPRKVKNRMNLDGLNIAVFKNAYKKQDKHPDYNIVVKDGDKVIAEGGAYIATDRQSGDKKRDKNGNTYMLGKLKAPRDRESGSPPTETNQPAGQDDDVPF